MPRRWSCVFPPSLRVVLAATLALAGTGHAAPRPLPDLSPEEIALRAMVQPLRDGASGGDDLQPLDDWFTARESAGKGRDAEREIQRVLKRIHEDCEKDLLHAAEWVQTLQNQRALLCNEISEEEISLRRAVERSQELSPVPTEEELWPGRMGFSDGFIAGDTGAIPGTETPDDAPHEVSSELDDRVSSDLDASRILDRLTLELTALRHLLHECDNEYERERERHRTAVKNLAELLQARGANTSGPAGDRGPPARGVGRNR